MLIEITYADGSTSFMHYMRGERDKASIAAELAKAGKALKGWREITPDQYKTLRKARG